EPDRSLTAPALLGPPAICNAGPERRGRDTTRQYAAPLHRHAPLPRADLGTDRAVQAGRDLVQGILDERAVDRGATAMTEVRADPDPHVGGHRATLRQHVLQIRVARDVAPRDAPKLDRIVTGGIDHRALETLLEARACLGAEIGLVVRETEQDAHVRGDEAVVEPEATHERPADVVPSQGTDVKLERAGLQVVVGELLENTLGGQSDGRTNGQHDQRNDNTPSNGATARPSDALSIGVRHWSPGSRS